MRILLITDAWEPQVNGVVRTYQNIIRETEKLGYEVKVISPSDFMSFALPFYKEIELAVLPYRKLVRMIKDFQPNAIHIPVEGPLGLAARQYCLRHHIEFTTSFHTMFPDYVAKRAPKFLKKWLYDTSISVMRWFHRPAKSVFVATESLEQQLKEWNFQNQFVRLLRGVDTTIFHPPKQPNDKTDMPTLVYVGRVAVEKNITAFLDIDIPSRKIIVGHGPDLDRLKKDYPDAEFLGLKTGKDLADAYRMGDCFVFPSKTDTFGIVLIEAMACGLPIAGYNVTGPKDLITEDFMGAISDDLTIAIENALKAPGTAQKRFTHIKDTYCWKSVAKTFLSQYKL